MDVSEQLTPRILIGCRPVSRFKSVPPHFAQVIVTVIETLFSAIQLWWLQRATQAS
jgi:hypothetical protein